MGMRAAINEKCKDCIYDELQPGTWRKQVANCKDSECPIYVYRPLDSVTKSQIKDSKEG